MPRNPPEKQARVVVCLFDLAVWTLKTTNRFPRNHRVTLGDRMDALVLDMALQAHQASFRKDKTHLLWKLSEDLESFRILSRIAVELGCLQGRQCEYAARQIADIGRQLGGWIKQQEGLTAREDKR